MQAKTSIKETKDRQQIDIGFHRKDFDWHERGKGRQNSSNKPSKGFVCFVGAQENIAVHKCRSPFKLMNC